MALKGRHPVPTSAKKLAGTYRKDRDNGGFSYPLITATPRAEEWMLEPAKKYYVGCCDILIDKGLLNVANITQVAMMAQAYAKYREAEEMLKEEGSVDHTNSGYRTPSPWAGISSRNMKEYLGIAMTFGFDPISAMKIKATGAKKEDSFDEFFKKHS